MVTRAPANLLSSIALPICNSISIVVDINIFRYLPTLFQALPSSSQPCLAGGSWPPAVPVWLLYLWRVGWAMGPLLKSSTLALMILNHRPEVFDAGPDKRRCPQPDAAACTSNQDGPDPLAEYGENCPRPTSHPLVGPSTQLPAHLAFQQEKLCRRGGTSLGLKTMTSPPECGCVTPTDS